MNLEDLKKPFQPRQHDFNYEGWAYIGEDAITTRLDDVCGVGGWQLKQTELRQVTATHWVVAVELSILINGQWVVRAGVGEGTTSINKPYGGGVDPLDDPRYVSNMGENAAKGAATDAFRRAARLWGIGRYLLDLPKDPKGKPSITTVEQLGGWLRANYAKESETKEEPSPAPRPVLVKDERFPNLPPLPVDTRKKCDRELIARSTELKMVYKIEVDSKADVMKNKPRWVAWFRCEEIATPLYLFEEHIQKIRDELALDAIPSDWTPYVNEKTPLAILSIWEGKGDSLFNMKLSDVFPMNENPALRMRFYQLYKGTSPELVHKALGCTSGEYEGSLNRAIERMSDVLEGQEQLQRQAVEEVDIPQDEVKVSGNPYVNLPSARAQQAKLLDMPVDRRDYEDVPF